MRRSRIEWMVPIAESPDALSVIVVEGAGERSSWQPTFGRRTRPLTRLIARRDGTLSHERAH